MLYTLAILTFLAILFYTLYLMFHDSEGGDP